MRSFLFLTYWDVAILYECRWVHGQPTPLYFSNLGIRKLWGYSRSKTCISLKRKHFSWHLLSSMFNPIFEHFYLVIYIIRGHLNLFVMIRDKRYGCKNCWVTWLWWSNHFLHCILRLGQVLNFRFYFRVVGWVKVTYAIDLQRGSRSNKTWTHTTGYKRVPVNRRWRKLGVKCRKD